MDHPKKHSFAEVPTCSGMSVPSSLPRSPEMVDTYPFRSELTGAQGGIVEGHPYHYPCRIPVHTLIVLQLLPYTTPQHQTTIALSGSTSREQQGLSRKTPIPNFRPIGYHSRYKPPFRVRSHEVALNPKPLNPQPQQQVYLLLGVESPPGRSYACRRREVERLPRVYEP